MYASRNVQQSAAGTLATLPEDVIRAGIKAPALIVIGEVVQLQSLLQFTPTAMQLNEIAGISEIA